MWLTAVLTRDSRRRSATIAEMDAALEQDTFDEAARLITAKRLVAADSASRLLTTLFVLAACGALWLAYVRLAPMLATAPLPFPS